jgi:hypothetical protein
MVELRQIRGRAVYTRPDLIRLRGRSLAYFEGLYRNRDANGHPAPIGKMGKFWAWDAATWDEWYDARIGPSKLDRTGDPDDLITLAEAARVLGSKPTSITRYPNRPPRGWPEPDEVKKMPGGTLRRKYRRHKIWAYGDAHKG